MTTEKFITDCAENLNDFAYDDGKISIGIFPDGRDFVCYADPDGDPVTFSSYDDVLDKFMVDGRPFRDVLPDINENLL